MHHWSRVLPLLLLAGMVLPGESAHAQVATQAPAEGPVASYVPETVAGETFPLTIREIMRGNEIVGQGPSSVSWTDDSRWIYFRWLPAGHEFDASMELWRVPAEGGEPEHIEDPLVADSLSLTFGGGDLSPDRSVRVTSWRGDLFLVDRSDLSVQRLTYTQANEGSPRFSADGESIVYSQGGQLYRMDLATGMIRQLTDIRSGEPDEESEPEGHDAFLHDQQEDLFEYIRRLQDQREEREGIQERREEAQELKAAFTGNGWNPFGLNLDPRGEWVALQANQSGQDTRSVMVPRWVTEDGYTEGNEVRTKVGDLSGSRSRVGLHRIGTDSIIWPDVDGAIEAYRETGETFGAWIPEQLEQLAEGEVAPGSVSFRGWNDAGTLGIVTVRSDDNKHRWTLTLEAETADLTVLEHLADSAWIAGPCSNCVGWIPDSDRVYYVSEADRFAQLYAIDADGTNRTKLTDGEWEVHQIRIPEQRTHFYLRTNEGSPHDQHLYRMDFDGSNRTRVTSGEGHFDADVSPDGSRLAVVHSYINRPPELFVAENSEGASLEQVTTSPSDEWLSFPWIDAEIIRFEARDGTMVPARIYRPEDLGAEPNGGAVLFVHGAGYLQNVHNWWSSYYREYMFHHFLVAQGFTVLDVDYRGSAGYGRDWRTAIYRHMGGWDLSDFTDGVGYLAENEGVDPDRIGIYGGSYGGFITLMALFTEPDVFEAGAALRSVTDWAHYNQGYTSNILNLPQDDPEAYEQSSPIYFAEGLRGHLLMSHSMYDTNVHFSDIVRLTQRLLELGKENWELAVQPTENHGMTDPWTWTDVYRRMYELFWSTLSAPGCSDGRGMCEMPVYTDSND